MRKIVKVTTERHLKFGSEIPRQQFFEAATPGVVFEVEAPWIWITWKGETKGEPVSRVSVEGEPTVGLAQVKK